MPKFIKKPIIIEAVRWMGNNFAELTELFIIDNTTGGVSSANRSMSVNPDKTLTIRTLEGDMTANLADWIIKGIKNEIYPCKNEIFMATYEQVERAKW